MSLASCLLKYLFVHRSCKVPWKEIIIQRSPPPHRRPFYDSAARNWDGGAIETRKEVVRVEFNVSHQGYITALAGCQIPISNDAEASSVGASLSSSFAIPQLGIDITCTNDPTRRRAAGSASQDSYQPKTENDLQSFIDIFAEVFSSREIQDMKNRSSSSSPSVGAMQEEQKFTSINHRLRLFYTYWALKEAYIKMTGEALLAPWLRDLEFVDVEVPEPAATLPSSTSSSFGKPQITTKARLEGRDIENVRLETVGFEKDYIFATSARGGGFGAESSGDGSGSGGEKKRWDDFRLIDIERDVAPCARGICRCLV